MPRYECVHAVVCYEKDLHVRYPLVDSTELAPVYRIHYLEIDKDNGVHHTLIDYRYEKSLPYPHDSLESMIADILGILHSHHYSLRKWYDFGRLYYDILFVDIHNPLHIEHFAVRE